MKKTIFSILILCLFIFFGIKTINLNEVIGAVNKIKLSYLILLGAFAIVIHIIKAYRYYLVNKTLNINTPYLDILKAFTAAQALSVFPAGDALKPIIYSKEENISGKKASVPFINQALFELLIPILITIVGSLYYSEIKHYSFISIIFFIIIVFVFLNNKILTKLVSILHLEKLNNTINYIQNNLQKTLIKPHKYYPRKTFFAEFFLTLLTTVFSGILLLLISKELGINLPLLIAIFIFSAGSVISGIATITPGGSGFTEGGMVWLLLLTKVADYSTAITIVLLFRLVTFLLFLIIGLITLLIFYKSIIFNNTKV